MVAGRPARLDVGVRRATARDLPRVAETMAAAFGGYDFVRAALPGERFEQRLRALYRLFAELTLRDGELWVAADGLAAAMWQPPGAVPADDPDADARLQELLGEGLQHYVRAAMLGSGHRPDAPHWYLDVLGTDPRHRGRGLARALLAAVLTRCDADRVTASTDTSAPETLAFYAHHGFAVRAEYDEPDGGPHVWVLERPPASLA